MSRRTLAERAAQLDGLPLEQRERRVLAIAQGLLKSASALDANATALEITDPRAWSFRDRAHILRSTALGYLRALEILKGIDDDL